MTYRKYPDDVQGPTGPPGPAGSGIVVANGAGFAGVATAALAVGTEAWITCYRTWGRLALAADAGPVVADQVFAADVPAYVWVREATPLRAWSEQATWEVDTGAGSNENTGAPGSPLLTLEEWFRRVPEVTIPDYLVTVTGNVPTIAGDQSCAPGLTGCRVRIKGKTSTLASGNVLAIAAPNIAGNLAATLDCSPGIADWTPYLQGVLETTLPSNQRAWSVVGRQPVAPVADTGPWATYANNAFAGLFAPTGTSAAPAVGAEVRVISMPAVTGTVVRLAGDTMISYALETWDLQTVNNWQIRARTCVVAGCKMRDGGPSGVTMSTPVTFVSGAVTGAVGSGWFPSGFVSFYGLTCFRTISITSSSADLSLVGLTLFGAGFTIGNTVGGAGPKLNAQTLSGGGGCSGIGVHGAAANATSNPLGDAIVVRGGAWFNVTNANAYGQGGPGVFIRAWGGGNATTYPGAPPGVGTLGAFDLGQPSYGTAMPPVLVGGAWPPPLALPSTWAIFAAASPGGFQGYASAYGSTIAVAK